MPQKHFDALRQQPEKREADFERCKDGCVCSEGRLCAATYFARCPTCKQLKTRLLGGERMGEADCRMVACRLAREEALACNSFVICSGSVLNMYCFSTFGFNVIKLRGSARDRYP